MLIRACVHAAITISHCFQYITSLQLGYTFGMSFIAMRSKLWRELLKVDTPEDLVGGLVSIQYLG